MGSSSLAAFKVHVVRVVMTYTKLLYLRSPFPLRLLQAEAEWTIIFTSLTKNFQIPVNNMFPF